MTTATRERAVGARAAAVALLALLVVDAALIGLHLRYGEVDRQFSLATDRGYAERFGYLKLLFTSALLIGLYWRVRVPAYFGWAFALLVILLDDALTIHEDVGRQLTERLSLQPAFGLRAQDFGELATWSGLALALLIVVGLAHHGSSPSGRRDSRVLFGLLVALTLFASGADMVHVVLSGTGADIAMIVEDGGELVVLSVIAAYVIAATSRAVHSEAAGRVPSSSGSPGHRPGAIRA